MKAEELSNKELNYIECLLNEEIYEQLRKGILLNNDYIITLRDILKKLNLKELYDYDIRFKENAKCEKK